MVSGFVFCAFSSTAYSQDHFAIQNNLILGNNNVFHAEIPSSLTGQALVAEPSDQDIFVLGLLFNNIPGVMPAMGAVRYGRTGARGEARIVAGVTNLGIPYQAGKTYAPSGGVASSAQGPVLGVATGIDAQLYLYTARTLAQYVPGGSIANSVDLSQAGTTQKVRRIIATIGNGTKLYVADATQPILAEYDLMTGMSNVCQVDSQPTALALSGQGQVQVLTAKGTAQFQGDCSTAMLMSQAPVPMPIPLNTLALPPRTFEITERIIEPTLPPAQPGSTARRGTYVTLVGSNPVTVNISAGSCTRTQFLAGTTFATPTATNQLNLTPAQTTLALYAQQTFPGEDCYAILSSGTGEALLRIRGEAENLGATVFLLDRSWSMERSTSGIGAAVNSDDERVTAMRHALTSFLGAVNRYNTTGGPWAFMPFTNDAPSAWATPQSGFGTPPQISDPQSPNGLRIKGFSGTGTDKLDPGGPNDLTQSMRSALARLETADMLPADPTGWARRLWILSDNESGRAGYGTYQAVLTTMQKARASLQYFSVGGYGLDPLVQQMIAQSWGFGGDYQFGPARGASVETHTPSGLHEALVSATVRQVLRGRPLGTIGRGEINKNNNQSLTATFSLSNTMGSTTSDPWVLLLAAYDNTDVTPQISVKVSPSFNPILLGCVQSPTAMMCAFPGQTGNFTATLTTTRPGGASTFGVLRAYVASWGPDGEVLMYSGLAQSLYKSGQKVRVQAYLTERGLPLRLATVTAKVYGPNLSLGTLVSQTNADQNALSNLITSNGDLSPGQAKVELQDPSTLPGQKPIALNLTLVDDGSGADNEPQDGIYQGEFQAFIPGLYTIDIHADYMGLFPNNTGSVEDRLTANVVAGLDQNLTSGSVQSQMISGGLRLRFTPQDSGKNMLGPGQAGALQIAQGTKISAATIDDFLDGSYRADVTDLDVTQPFDLIAPGSRVQLYPPTGTPTMSSGCSVAAGVGTPAALHAPLYTSGGSLLVAALLLLSARRRRRALHRLHR